MYGTFAVTHYERLLRQLSQLNVTKRLPISRPNIFGFVITQRRVFLRLFVRLGVYHSGV